MKVLTAISNFLSELRRRNVFMVGVAYGIVAWLMIQIILAMESPLHLLDWVDTLFLIIGFPLALMAHSDFQAFLKKMHLDDVSISALGY
jgi:hypothetical protein